jgi:hypothetical protein
MLLGKWGRARAGNEWIAGEVGVQCASHRGDPYDTVFLFLELRVRR